MDKIVERIVRASGVADLFEVLAARLAPTDLQSLLLAVFARRAAAQTPARVLDQYAHNRFVRPAGVNALALADLDRLAFATAQPLFTPLELAPVAPLGSITALGGLDPHWTVATVRNTEVVSDSTNVLALECALRRRALRTNPARAGAAVHLCASHRLLRAQQYNRPEMRAHFRLFALVSAGRAAGSAPFECATLADHLGRYLAFLGEVGTLGYRLGAVRVALTDLAGGIYQAALEQVVIAPLAAQFPAVRFGFDPDRTQGRNYYERICFGLYAQAADGHEYMLADGGFTPWTQQLLSDQRERLLIGGIATERIADLFDRRPVPA
jgi:hypothetical protein